MLFQRLAVEPLCRHESLQKNQEEESMKQIKIIIVDDHTVFRNALKVLLAQEMTLMLFVMLVQGKRLWLQ